MKIFNVYKILTFFNIFGKLIFYKHFDFVIILTFFNNLRLKILNIFLRAYNLLPLIFYDEGTFTYFPYTSQFTAYSVYSVQCTVYSVQCVQSRKNEVTLHNPLPCFTKPQSYL